MSANLTELTIRCPRTLADLLVAVLFEAGAAGVEERSTETTRDQDASDEEVEVVVYSNDEEQLNRFEEAVVAAIADGTDERVARASFDRREVTTDWEHEWLRHLRPVPIGDDLVVQPLGDESPLPRGRRALVLRPSWAFGDGSHPTTQLAGDSVERYCHAHRKCRVLDVGTGSGVLAFVALMSGAATAKLIDTAPEAVAAAQENAELNRLGDRCAISNQPLGEVEGSFDLVVCNINESTLLSLADDLARLVAPSGQLSITGLIRGETAAVEAALGNRGLSLVAREELKDWVLIELRRA
jgi:ribosomal protein L11 methyltransferase